ncbi:lipoprotein [Psychrobacter sp. B38]|uniref:LPS translocon maturation chaperone LptM n=1 Tax=Psychrobacter sp. B38 TaxID=3143538 RepID=UPI003210E332
MLTIQRASKLDCITVANTSSASRRVVSTLLISGAVMLGMTGCGQKGALYLEESNSQTGQSSTEMLESTSHPQDAAFAGIDEDNRQQTPDMALPKPSDDPNDY